MMHQEIKWSRLDNFSKIFPATWSPKDPKVFRLSCELFEAIEEGALQRALDITMDNFPLYKYVLRRGLFWYYLESSDLVPKVEKESQPICAPIYTGLRTNLLFRVSYYKCRVNLEMFHVLSDGAGAIKFLRTLMFNYLTLLYKERFANVVLSSDASSISELMDDSYNRHYIDRKTFREMAKKEKRQIKVNAYKIHGTRTDEYRLSLIEGSMSVKAVLNEAHKYNTTLTVYITSLYIYSIYKTMSGRKKDQPIVLTVPVNLRQFFESHTGRNFFGTIHIGYNFAKNPDDLKLIIKSIADGFKSNLNVEKLNLQLYKAMTAERNPFARLLPLPMKDFFIRTAVKTYDKYTTSNISNIGRIELPPEFCEFIRQFSVCTSVRKPQLTMCSYNDRLVISISSPFKEMEIQRTFFQMLSKAGIDIEITSNL